LLVINALGKVVLKNDATVTAEPLDDKKACKRLPSRQLAISY